MLSKIARVRSRSWAELRIFAGSVCMLTFTRLALPVFSLATVTRMVRRVLTPGRPFAGTQRRTEREVIWAVEAAARRSPVGSTCLTTALVAQALLSRHGYEARLRIGVRRDQGAPFAAHAWLEREGKIIVGGPVAVVESYTPLPDLEHLIA
jgi:hypothetical protein